MSGWFLLLLAFSSSSILALRTLLSLAWGGDFHCMFTFIVHSCYFHLFTFIRVSACLLYLFESFICVDCLRSVSFSVLTYLVIIELTLTCLELTHSLPLN